MFLEKKEGKPHKLFLKVVNLMGVHNFKVNNRLLERTFFMSPIAMLNFGVKGF